MLVLLNKHGWRVVCCWLVTVAYSICLSASVSIPDGHSLHHALNHFEVLHKHHLKHRNSIGSQKTIVFSTLGRTFKLNLSSRKHLFSNDLAIQSIGAGGETHRHVLDTTQFFTGHVEGEAMSRVTAHLNHAEGVLSASIHTDTERYFIEPSSRHFSQSHDFHMISYRGSDLKYNITKNSSSYCGTPPNFLSAPSSTSLPAPPPPRSSARDPRLLRRQATSLGRDTCPLLLVATGRFHQAYSEGTGSIENTILFMVQVIDDIDQTIFRPSRWDSDIQDFGLTIQNITVFDSSDGGPPYNSDRTDWESTQMLRLFSHSDWSDFCLAHLFAFQQFTDGLVGVAYPASADNFPGGICTEALPDFNGGAIATANVGLSSYQGNGGRRLLLAEGRLITAHEIGHNWGSEHDPTKSIGPCNPPLSNKEGKFLMFPSMSDGTQPNNDVFSNCSLGIISEVLRAKSQRCFAVREGTRCGNYEVEDGEDCDAGLRGMLGFDSCCNAQCHLKPDKNCSDTNHACCTDCAFSPPTTVCRTFPAINGQCYTSILCDGVNKTCPTEIPLAEVNSTCRGNGLCLYNGTVCDSDGDCTDPPESPFNHVECYDFCRLQNRQQCFCNDSNECYFCCQEQLSSSVATPPSCLVAMPPVPLPDGTSCVGGLCESGRCKPITQDLVNRLFSLFTDISIDAFFQFMSENIVGTVVFLTAVIWIVGGSIVYCIDEYHFRRYREAITELEEDRAGNIDEDQFDHTYLDNMTPLVPGLDSTHRIKRGLSRMGSRSRSEYSGRDRYRQYSIGSGYRRPSDRLVYGRRLSSILRQSKRVDPSSNIMQHILESGTEQSLLREEEEEGVVDLPHREEEEKEGKAGTLV